MKYRAHIEIDGRKLVVFPRSKKTSLFNNVATAENKLNLLSKRLTKDARGIVTDMFGNVVLTMAL